MNNGAIGVPPFMRGVAEVIVGAAEQGSRSLDTISESVAVCPRGRTRVVEAETGFGYPSTGTDDGMVWRIQLIAADVEGSSGYYPADVLRRDGPRIFSAGTHVYLDHPTASEETDRPERSVRDLAGVLIEDARFEDGPQGRGLFALMRVFAEHAQRISELAPYVGMSIRAMGVKEYDPRTGRDVVTELVHAQSVDIVTHAGAGGRLLHTTDPAPW